MSNWTDSAVAIVVVLGVHVAVLVLALRAPGLPRVDTLSENDALDVIWIPRRVVDSRPQTFATAAQAKTHTQRRSRLDSTPSLVPMPATDASSAPNAALAQHNAVRSVDGSLPGRLDLRLREPALTFERNPIARRGPPIEAYQDRMTLQFTDRSVGGTLQRMANRTVCAELRRSLRTAEGGAYGVIESMRENGCPI